MNSDSSSTKPRRPLWLRILLGLVFAVVALGALVTLLLVGDRIRTRAQWNDYVEAARARGQKLMIEEFVHPPVEDAQNFAAIPLFQDLFKQDIPSKPLDLPDLHLPCTRTAALISRSGTPIS